MYNDPNKQGFNNYANQYPPMNQPPPYPHYPPPGAVYPGQQPTYQHSVIVAQPTPYRRWTNLVPTPITSGLKTFLVISGIFYLIWSVLGIGLEIGIIVNSYSTYYRGIWTGVFFFITGILMLVASCQTSYVLENISRFLVIDLSLGILALILSIVNLSISTRCSVYVYWYSCDYSLATNLKITILVLFIVAIAHTIAGLVVISNAQKRARTSAGPNVLRN
ncbi:unnamed protein product [Adineta ricciae]|uniref:MARVEL domain-containing protein n=1 Tax=Adineta ricciae TaxID=249248 RepID=A0A815ERL1_ADIRI|nr:unnamed protein product [Adineta ricciae]CAF1315987.1 unnamed protein product [Adineta ricciae]